MKVLFIAFDTEEYSLRLAGALADSAEVCLMLSANAADRYRRWLSPAVNFQPFDKPRLRQPWQQLRLQRQIIRRIRAFDPDVIHFQKSHFWFNLALPFLADYPLVISVHDPRDHSGDRSSRKTPQWIKDFGYRRATRIIAHSRQMKPAVVEALGVSPSIVDVVPLIAFGDENAAPDAAEIDGRILFFGRLWAYKGLEYFIRAEPLIAAAAPHARFVIAGRGEDLDPYRALMTDPDRYIIHNKYVSTEEQARLFREASVVVLPYTEATQSGVIPVAYNFERPVVASAVGGLLDQVEDGRTGFLIPPRDVDALAARVNQLLADPALRQQMGAKGRAKLESEWSPATVARQTLAVYERAIATRHDRFIPEAAS